jgi:hypothetical protein
MRLGKPHAGTDPHRVPPERGPTNLQMVEQFDDVGSQSVEVVGGWAARPVALAVSAMVE